MDANKQRKKRSFNHQGTKTPRQRTVLMSWCLGGLVSFSIHIHLHQKINGKHRAFPLKTAHEPEFSQ
jgi:hypothetical protein